MIEPVYFQNPTCFIMIGIKGSGKSYWVNYHRDRFERPTHIASKDELIRQAADHAGVSVEEAVALLPTEILIQSVVDEVAHSVQNNRSVVIDQVENIYYTTRHKLLSLIPDHYYRVAVVTESPLPVLKERLKKTESDNTNVPYGYNLYQQLTRYDKPKEKERYHKIERVVTFKAEQDYEMDLLPMI